MTNLSSAELAQRVVKVKDEIVHAIMFICPKFSRIYSTTTPDNFEVTVEL